ncbi:hypothetical protein EV421DRAFT_2018403 [Armillaria borealis]|uniref:Uncharacterized protein n=1 Tax=Armillaria borealis TaxID=47425 RepID=A0AA39JMC7_9AGAR|nr:hypothetical protein EV421DRAFT_2018403 [Armillaria borealis]
MYESERGRTRFPWNDAIVRQDGLDPFARHSVAVTICFPTDFTRKKGADAKAKYLIDWDPSANPARQERQERAVKFCPELAQFPDKIFKRKKAGGAVEYDYPAPILDPELEKKRCMVRIKAAYAQGFHGTNHEIPGGSADDILRGSYKEALGQVDYADSRRRFHVEAETGRRWR